MKMQEIREMAKEYNIKTSRMSKMKLIQEIQASEGNFDCFASATSGECDQVGCLWRKDCFDSAKKLHS
jgi:hypothetical protein